jgi:hypothetical protein
MIAWMAFVCARHHGAQLASIEEPRLLTVA